MFASCIGGRVSTTSTIHVIDIVSCAARCGHEWRMKEQIPIRIIGPEVSCDMRPSSSIYAPRARFEDIEQTSGSQSTKSHPREPFLECAHAHPSRASTIRQSPRTFASCTLMPRRPSAMDGELPAKSFESAALAF